MFCFMVVFLWHLNTGYALSALGANGRLGRVLIWIPKNGPRGIGLAVSWYTPYLVGGNSNIFGISTPKIGEDFQFDEHMFQMGWFNHQPVMFGGIFFLMMVVRIEFWIRVVASLCDVHGFAPVIKLSCNSGFAIINNKVATWHGSGFCSMKQHHLSNEKNLGCLGYIGNYTTQLCGDYNKPL